MCLEEGTQSAWLCELLKPHVSEVVVAMAPERKSPKDDRRDAWARANELRTGAIETRVFKAPEHLAGLRNAVRAYGFAVTDVVRAKNRLKSVFLSRGISTDASVYNPTKRTAWLKELSSPHVELAEWYSGLGIVTRSSADWVQDRTGNWVRPQHAQTRGLSRKRQPRLKAVFKGAATTVIAQLTDDPLHADHERMLNSGIKPTLAKLTLARKIAGTVLSMWKHQEVYDPKRHRPTLEQK